MHIIKNSRGNEVIYQSESLKNCWGHIDDKGDYLTERDHKEGQIFNFFGNALAIQLELLEYLEKKYPNGNIKIYVKNYEKEGFLASCPTLRFRDYAMRWQKECGKAAIFNYDNRYGQQIRLPMNYWTRKYINQKVLEV